MDAAAGIAAQNNLLSPAPKQRGTKHSHKQVQYSPTTYLNINNEGGA